MNYPAAELRGIRGEKHRLSRTKDFTPEQSCEECFDSKDVWKDQLKRQAGFGKKMEELSVSSCREFARQFGYGFYIGATLGPGTGRILRQ